MIVCQSSAQHADLGTGTLKNQIWWLNWSGLTVTNGVTRTFTTNDGLTITATFSNATTREPSPTTMSSNYFGSMLWVLYNFSDATILPSLYDGPGLTGAVKFTISVSASRNGVPVPFYLVTADAEASWEGEITTFTTNGTSWQCINLFRNSSLTVDPLTGCGSQTTSIHDTFDGNSQEGQSPIIMTQAPPATPLSLDITMDHNGTFGGMAVAFGILQSEDRGDLPVTGYGTVQHQLNYTVTNACSYPTPLPSMTQDTRLFIGSVPGDADPIQYTDDNAIGVDEEALSTFPVYDGSGSYTLSFPVNNTTGGDAWLTGWFDYNRNGTFDPVEGVTVLVPNNATTASITWSGLPAYLPQGGATGYGFRFRISTDKLATQQPTGFAVDGEAEDYLVPPQTLCAAVPAAITAPPSVCMGQQLTLYASAASGSTYAWSPATGLSDPTAANPKTSLTTTTTYTVTATTPQGCSGNATATITASPLPVITAGNNTTICQNDPTTLHASGGATYSWTASDPSFHATGATVTTVPSHSTDYYVTGADANGCSAMDTVSIIVHDIPVFSLTPTDTTLCANSPLKLTASGGDQYTWQSASGAILGADSSINVPTAGNGLYEVTISDHICRLTSTLSATINAIPPPQMSVTASNDINCTIGQATLEATGAYTYRWQAAPGITNLTSAYPVVSPSRTTTYYVTGRDINGCSSIDSVIVKVNDASDPSAYPVPSAFTPNNDGRNDCFGLKYWGHITKLEMSVFNRWGVRVFYTTDPQQCWDGTFNGTPQPAGGYAYQIMATTDCGVAYRKGIVILVR
jgi:gliding motility-associated-like protein